MLVEKDVVSTFLTFHLLKLSRCTQIQVEGWLDSTVAAGADKANNKQIGKRSGHYRITGFLVILMFFVEDGRCDSLATGLLPITVREVAFPTKGLDFVVMSVCSGLRFYKDVCPEVGGRRSIL